MKIAEFLKPESVICELASSSKADVLKELSASLARANPSIPAQRLATVLEDRERLGSTGIGEGVAIPHGKLAGLPTLSASFGVSRAGVDFDAIDQKRTHLFFALVAPENSAGLHLKALARISRVFKDAAFRRRLRDAADADAMFQVIADEDAKY